MLSPERLDGLQTQWLRLMRGLGLEPVAIYPVFDQLVAAHAEPQRHYHTMEHVAEVLRVAARLSSLVTDPTPVILAVWFHDAVYDPKAGDNEQKSAEMARNALLSLGLPGNLVERVKQLILATRHTAIESADAETSVLLDADLAILASADIRYSRYASDIRKEYAHVPDAEYRKGRTQVLQSFLARERIYRTEVMFTEGEARARQNLQQEIAILASPDSQI